MTKIPIYIFCFVTACSFGQDYYLPKIKTEGRFAKDFAPIGWQVTDSIKGDLNKDSLLDKVFIITMTDSTIVKDEGEDYKIRPQVLIIAFNRDNKKYRLSDFNKKILVDYNFPPKYGQPFNSMLIDNSILIIDFSFDYINGNFYFYTYKFRFQNNEFKLIGGEAKYVNRRTMDFENASYNFLTKKWSWTTGIYSSEDPSKLTEKTEWFDIKIDNIKTFKTIGQPGTWEITQGKRL